MDRMDDLGGVFTGVKVLGDLMIAVTGVTVSWLLEIDWMQYTLFGLTVIFVALGIYNRYLDARFKRHRNGVRKVDQKKPNSKDE